MNIALSGIREVLIVDSFVQDYKVLLLGIDPLIELRIVAHGEDGISQIIKAIELPSLTKLHILAHGAPGQINLGGKEITSDDFLSRIDRATKRDLDIVFWSCNVGLGDVGRAFVDSVVEVTGARVLVSQGLIGNAEKGGSWDLDGIVIPPFSKNAQNNYAGVLPAPAPKTVTGTAVSLAAGSGWLAGDSLIIRNTNSSDSATMIQLNKMRLGTNTTGKPGSIYSATVLDSIIQASDLLALVPLISTEIVVTIANKLVGAAADCEILLQNADIHFGENLNVLISSGLATVAQVNAIDLDNGTGTITATISDGAASTLATLSGTHAYTVTVTSTSAAATTLTAIDNATSVTVTATAVTTVTGTATEVALLLSESGISTSAIVDATGDNTDVVITNDEFSGLTTSGGGLNLSSLIVGTAGTGDNYIFSGDGAHTGTLRATLGGDSLIIGGGTGTWTIGMGSSGITNIGITDSETKVITAASGTSETFTINSTAISVTLLNLEVNDIVDFGIDTTLTSTQLSLGAVDSAGEYYFDSTVGYQKLTYWDNTYATTISLTGVTDFSINSDTHGITVTPEV